MYLETSLVSLLSVASSTSKLTPPEVGAHRREEEHFLAGLVGGHFIRSHQRTSQRRGGFAVKDEEASQGKCMEQKVEKPWKNLGPRHFWIRI